MTYGHRVSLEAIQSPTQRFTAAPVWSLDGLHLDRDMGDDGTVLWRELRWCSWSCSCRRSGFWNSDWIGAEIINALLLLVILILPALRPPVGREGGLAVVKGRPN